MVKKTAKKAAPVRKKAVAKKAAPVRKKAVAKKAVAKKAAPVRKKAVAKKAAPVRKKAVAKKVAPVRKKAVAKKVAPVRKKAVAKKAAPVRKKAVAKKAVASKKTSSTKAIVLTKNETDKVSTSEKTHWSDAETELPAFLQSSRVEAKREIVQTQAYVKKKSKPVLLWPIVSFSTLAVISFATFSTGTFDKGSLEKSDSVMVAEKPSQAETAKPIPSPSESADPKQFPSPKESTRGEKKSVSNSDTLAPRLFAGAAAGEEVTFEWKSPINSGRVVGYELLTKPVGAQSWTSISSVTVDQLSVTVELSSLVSTSDYRVASVLDNGKLIYNPSTLSFVGVVG